MTSGSAAVNGLTTITVLRSSAKRRGSGAVPPRSVRSMRPHGDEPHLDPAVAARYVRYVAATTATPQVSAFTVT